MIPTPLWGRATLLGMALLAGSNALAQDGAPPLAPAAIPTNQPLAVAAAQARWRQLRQANA